MAYFERRAAAGIKVSRYLDSIQKGCCAECDAGRPCRAVAKQTPFSPDDAVQHIGEVDNAKRREWAQVANTTFRAEIEAGVAESTARRRAIRAANERFEKQDPRCPPGQVWRGGRCVPKTEEKGVAPFGEGRRRRRLRRLMRAEAEDFRFGKGR